jgi:hypothetical protein
VIDALRQGWQRVRSFFAKEPLDRDLDAEMAAHLEFAIEENMQQGMAAEEARRRALIRFGGVVQAKEQHRETRGLPWLDILMQDLRYTFRTLVCCFQRRDDVFTFRRRGRSHPRPALIEPDAKIGRRPSLLMLWRIGGLWSLHVQGQQKEQVRGRGQGRLLKPILVPKEVYEQADRCSWSTRSFIIRSPSEEVVLRY